MRECLDGSQEQMVKNSMQQNWKTRLIHPLDEVNNLFYQ